ncbi:hypothetical protein LTR53_003938 [Teratosphaeriaceae sp. CCFEE 6253]|nr:hypothetical protein LTR53_003938 [Teratosphaeriaceae sp. CCFEE 6253]
MSSPVTATVTLPSDVSLSAGTNTVWLTDDGALTPIFVDVESSTTTVIGGAAPIGAAVVLAASAPAQTTYAQAPSESSSTVTPAALMATSSAAPTPSTPPASVVIITQTVSSLGAYNNIALPVAISSTDSYPQFTAATLRLTTTQTTLGPGMGEVGTPSTSIAASQGHSVRAKEHSTVLAIAIVIPVVVVFLGIVFSWLITRRKRTPIGGDQVSGEKTMSETDSSTALPQELEARPGRGRAMQYF